LTSTYPNIMTDEEPMPSTVPDATF